MYIIIPIAILKAPVTLKKDGFLGYSAVEKPLACQVGGNDPVSLAEVTKIIADKGYDGI